MNCHFNNGLSLDEIESVVVCETRDSTYEPAHRHGQPPVVRVPVAPQRVCLRHGAVRVDSTFLVQSIYGAIQEYGGFERPEWLD